VAGKTGALSMSITISAPQGEALWRLFESTLDPSCLAQLWRAVEKREFDTADSIAQEYADTLDFLIEDLSWGAGLGEDFELRSPPDLLFRVFTRVGEEAAEIREATEPEREEARQEEEWNRLLEEASRDVLAVLAEGEG